MILYLTAPKWIKMFVLDEADEMLSRGFKDQIYEIFQKLNTSIQVSFISHFTIYGWRLGLMVGTVTIQPECSIVVPPA